MENPTAWVFIALALVVLTFVLANGLQAKFKIPAVLTMLFVGLIFNWAFIQTGYVGVDPTASVDNGGYIVMQTVFQILMLPTLVYLMYAAGNGINPKVVKKMGYKGVSMSIAPFMAEALLWSLLLFSIHYMTGGWMTGLDDFKTHHAWAFALLIGLGLASATPGVVTPKLKSMMAEGKIGVKEETMVSTALSLESITGFILFIITYTLLGVELGDKGEAMDLVWLISMMTIPVIFAYISAKVYTEKIVPLTSNMQNKMLGNVALFVIFSMYAFVLYGFGDIINLSSAYIRTKPWYNGPIAILSFGYFVGLFLQKTEDKPGKLTESASTVGTWGLGLYMIFGQPALFINTTASLEKPNDIFTNWEFLLIAIAFTLFIVFFKYWMGLLVYKNEDAKTRKVVAAGTLAKGNAAFVHTTIALLALGQQGAGVSGTILGAYETQAITLAFLSAVLNVPIWDNLMDRAVA